MIILLLILAHLSADFIFQTSTMAAEKGKYKGHFWLHIGTHFVLYEAAFVVLSFSRHEFPFRFFLTGLCLALIHMVVDFAKEKFQSMFRTKESKTQKGLVFFTDQFVHFLSILLVARFAVPYRWFHLLHKVAQQVLHHHKFSLNLEQATIVILILIILATSFSGIVVELIVSPVPPDGDKLIETKRIAREDDTTGMTSGSLYGMNSGTNYGNTAVERTYISIPPATVSRGRLIGYLERIMTMLLITAAGYSSIGFIIATKSLVRFKQLDDRDFAEYFLIGTFTSILLGTMWGFVLKTFL